MIIGAAIAGWATIDPSYGTWRTLLGGLRLSALPSFIAACALFSALILLSFFGGRAYCNHICPIGTILGLVSRFSLYKVRIKHEKCPSGCTECEKHCRCGAIDPKSGKVNASLCINCLDCIRGVCPKDAIEFTPPQNKFFFSKDYKDLTK